MKKIYKAILAAVAALGLFSCTPYLDMTPTDSVSDKVMWENTQNAEYHVNYLYTYLYDVLNGQCVAGATEALTDMLKYGSYNFNAYCLIPSEIAYGEAVNMTVSYVDYYMGYWSSWYSGIAKVNKALDALKTFGQMDDEDKTRLEAEMKFIRAYLYFDLMKRYKEIILYDEDMTAYTKNKKVSTEEQGWKFVQDDLQFAADNLPDKTASRGRIDKGMAWGFMTRAMLYAKNYDKVIEAAGEVKKLGYALELNAADPVAAYKAAYEKTTGAGNTEAIIQYQFDRTNNVTHGYDFYYTPGGDYKLRGESGGGYGTPTQEMVESYELATGGFMDWTPWHSTTTQNPPYDKLEPRFHASILYNGADWKGRKIESFVGGADGWAQWNKEAEPQGRSTTGYYLRKLVDESHDVITESGSRQPLSILRYAEVLLNYAEACYHKGDAASFAAANDAVREIRARVGLPYADKAGTDLWTAIRQERKIELAYEGLWYWDLRRWEVAHKQYPEGLTGYQLHGLKIEKTGEVDVVDDEGKVIGKEPVYNYTYVSVDDKDRNFDRKMYRFPMNSSELSNNGEVDQYPEWK